MRDSPTKRGGAVARYKAQLAAAGRLACESCGWRVPQAGTEAGSERAINIHHVVPLAKGGADEEANLVALCPNHHIVAHRLTEESGRPESRGEILRRLRLVSPTDGQRTEDRHARREEVIRYDERMQLAETMEAWASQVAGSAFECFAVGFGMVAAGLRGDVSASGGAREAFKEWIRPIVRREIKALTGGTH